jgi:hypothetical protein
MPTYTIARPVADTQTQVLAFVKEAGLGTHANLMMVDGANTFLDHLTLGKSRFSLKIAT